MPTAAAVIDLDSFRARRAAMRAAPATAPVRSASPYTVTAAPSAYAPFWVVWVPAWPVR
jgi:hypothetical protein